MGAGFRRWEAVLRSSGSEERRTLRILGLRSEDWVEDCYRPRGVVPINPRSPLPLFVPRFRRTKMGRVLRCSEQEDRRAPHLRRTAPLSSKKLPLSPRDPSDLRSDLQGRRSKMGGSSFSGAEDRRLKMEGNYSFFFSEDRRTPPIFDRRSEDWVEDRHRPRGVIVLPLSCLRLRRTKNPSHLRSSGSKNEEPLLFVLRFRRTKDPFIFRPELP